MTFLKVQDPECYTGIEPITDFSSIHGNHWSNPDFSSISKNYPSNVVIIKLISNYCQSIRLLMPTFPVKTSPVLTN